MAGGGKETPRQQMVGMMYLVLTALLALQVSNAVLDKFIFIDQSLQQSIKIATGNNDKVMEGIRQQVEKNGNRGDDTETLNKAKQVREMTNELKSFLAEMRQGIIEKSGSYTEDGKLAGAKDYDKQMAYTLGSEGSKDGKAYELEKRLNDYAKQLSELGDSLQIDKMAKPASEMEQFKNDPDQKNKDFAELNFDHTPTVACLAVMSQFEQEVTQVESRALEYFAKQVGASIPKFDKIIAVANPESNVVAAGMPYKAKLFLAASSSTARPTMTTTAPGGVKVNNEGVGEIEFVAKGGQYDKTGSSTRTWTGRITLTLPTGDTTFNVDQEYTVVKPVIQIRSAAVQALYLNCGNELQVDVPALGNSYDPTFSAKGGEAIKGQRKGLVMVIPTAKKLVLSVSSGGNLIGSEPFNVRRVPKPEVKVFSRNRPVDMKQGVAAATLRGIELRAIPDPDFKAALPKDARYRVTRYVVTLARGKRAVASANVSGPKINLTSMVQKARPGDRIVVELKEVQRMNFKNRTENVPGMSADIFTIPLN